MPRYIKQKILSLEITKLKGIQNMSSLTFQPKSVTAVLGENCVGKSSILHALASCYQPEDESVSENHRMSEYLKPNPHALWNDTSYKMHYSYEENSNRGTVIPDHKEYSKSSARWKPIYARRPYRPIFFVGIHTTLPVLEYINFIKNKSKVGSQKIRYETEELNSPVANLVKQKVSYIFNRQYSAIYKHSIAGWADDLYGLAIDGMTYSQISMGAGEQRVLKILFTIFSAPKHSLILIDELDLLLHETAFQKIITVISARANAEELQVIFTTHRESVLKQSDSINIRYLKKINSEVHVLEQLTPNALSDLTGSFEKSVTVYVEDSLSSRIIKRIAQELRVKRDIQIVEFGAGQNCFTITAGVKLDSPTRPMMSVLDGDIYRTNAEKVSQMDRTITGTAPEARQLRRNSLDRIFQYELPEGFNPEQYIRNSIVDLPPEDLLEDDLELHEALANIRVVLDKHNYINEITNYYDESQEVIISQVVRLFAKTPQWQPFIREVKGELERLLIELNILTAPVDDNVTEPA